MATSNLNLYTLAAVYVQPAGQGVKLLTNEASVTLDRMTNSQIVETVCLGYAGESPGASRCEVSISNAVPSADFEFDPGSYMGSLQVVTFSLFAAGRTLRFDGFIISDNFSHAVNSASKLEFKARGSFSLWQ